MLADTEYIFDMNDLYVDKIIKEKNKIIYKYTVNGEWAANFAPARESCVEYSVDISAAPNSICIIPFIGNILPISWIFDAKIHIKSIDKNFYEHLWEVKKGYQEMYPMLEFKGDVVVDAIEDNTEYFENVNTAAFFSGGVDAYTTLFRHLDEKPTLFTVWGADIKLEDVYGWNNVWKHTQDVAKEFNLQTVSIKSDFRYIINEGRLSKYVKKSGDDWWHGFQNGIGIITHAAPLSYVLQISKVYIASSYPEKMKGKYTCASDPIIDNYIYYGSGQTVHDAYEWDRQQKIQYIIKRKKEENKPVSLRVCWKTSGGINCCRCEKCYRTILEIVSEGEEPNYYGFDWDLKGIHQCKVDLKYKIMEYQFNINQFYLEIQKRMISNKDKINNYEKYAWIEKYDFSQFNNGFIKKIYNYHYLVRVREILKKLFRGK